MLRLGCFSSTLALIPDSRGFSVEDASDAGTARMKSFRHFLWNVPLYLFCTSPASSWSLLTVLFWPVALDLPCDFLSPWPRPGTFIRHSASIFDHLVPARLPDFRTVDSPARSQCRIWPLLDLLRSLRLLLFVLRISHFFSLCFLQSAVSGPGL